MDLDSSGVPSQGRGRSPQADLKANHLRFLSSVSHNLRTPLTAVLGFAELLGSDTWAMSEKERAEYAATIANQAAVMSDVLENLLVSAQTEMGILSVVSVPVNLGAQLAQVIERVRTDMRCALRVDGTAAALGDPERVRQIIRNLLLNAELRGGPNILIRLSDHDDPALLTVIANGSDTPISARQRALDSETVGRAEDEIDPLELGLSVSRQLARLMHGDLDWRRMSGRSVFTLSLPALRGPANDGG